MGALRAWEMRPAIKPDSAPRSCPTLRVDMSRWRSTSSGSGSARPMPPAAVYEAVPAVHSVGYRIRRSKHCAVAIGEGQGLYCTAATTQQVHPPLTRTKVCSMASSEYGSRAWLGCHSGPRHCTHIQGTVRDIALELPEPAPAIGGSASAMPVLGEASLSMCGEGVAEAPKEKTLRRRAPREDDI